jgi:hypothetical protein
MEKHELDRAIRDAYHANDRKALLRLMALEGRRAGDRSVESFKWEIALIPPLMFGIMLPLSQLVGESSAWAVLIVAFILYAIVRWRPRLRRAMDEKREFEDFLFYRTARTQEQLHGSDDRDSGKQT